MKEEEELSKKGDVAVLIARVDFPVYMLTDTSKGVPIADEWSKEKFTAVMTPTMQNMPKGIKHTQKATISVLSDSLVNVTDNFTMTMGKDKLSGRNMAVLVKRMPSNRPKTQRMIALMALASASAQPTTL
jgi:hypothetical protein